MSKEEIKNLLIDFICEYDMTSWSNEKVYEKFSDIIYKKFTDLETKLAESEKKNFELVSKLNLKEHKPAFCTLAGRDCEALGQVEELKQQLALKENTITNLVEDNRASQEWYKKQLAEKEKEIEKSHLILDKILTEIHTNCYSGLNIVKFKEMVLNDLGGLIITHNQDKISFAVEQLEKVKEYIKTNLMSFQKVPIIQEIDNQIKQLKEMK